MEAQRTSRSLGRNILLAGLSLTAAASAYAQQAPSTSADTWQFTATPYLWTAGQSGSARIGSVIPAQNVDATFSDIFNNLDFGAMAVFEARKDRWGILADAFYIKLSHTSDPLLGGDLGTAQRPRPTASAGRPGRLNEPSAQRSSSASAPRRPNRDA